MFLIFYLIILSVFIILKKNLSMVTDKYLKLFAFVNIVNIVICVLIYTYSATSPYFNIVVVS